jgi:hypothetical protein
MHAVVTKATIHDINRGREFLNEKGIPRLKQAPGFVAGNWVSLDDGTGRGMVIFESEEAARAAAEQPRRRPGSRVSLFLKPNAETPERREYRAAPQSSLGCSGRKA